MQTVLRPMPWEEKRLFALCLGASLLLHVALAWLALPGGGADGAAAEGLADRFAQGVNAATGLDPEARGRLEQAVKGVRRGGWRRGEMAATLQRLAGDLGLPVEDCDVVRALDPERAREGRWDIRIWLRWGPERTVGDVLMLAYLVGEGTMKSDFGSHRLWVHLEAPDGSGRAVFETMDCRLYRAGKLSAADLLHRAAWYER